LSSHGNFFPREIDLLPFLTGYDSSITVVAARSNGMYLIMIFYKEDALWGVKRATDQNSPSNGTQFVCYRYDVARTYEGFDFRTPSELCNEMMLKVVSQAPDRYFGEWPLHIIQPYARRQRWTTPPVRITARFESSPICQDAPIVLGVDLVSGGADARARQCRSTSTATHRLGLVGSRLSVVSLTVG